jgi:hypothetical protein
MNNKMIEITVIYPDKDNTTITKLGTTVELSEIIEMNLPTEEVSLYYDNIHKYESRVKHIIKEVILGIYLVETNVNGYDTYSEGVFFGYTDEDARERALSFNRTFVGSLKRLGDATVDKNTFCGDDICTSFHAG